MSTTNHSLKALRPGDKVLVTGVTGFIGSHVADQLLKGGYAVKGTARIGSNKIDHLRQLFKSYGDKFDVVEIGELTEDNIFDDVVKDVDAIAHVASPVSFTVTDPFTGLIDPAVKGTISILDAAHRFGNKVKHVVVTSSVVAVLHPIESETYTYTESDWNDQAIESFKTWKTGESFNPGTAYFASKNEAERAIWRFVDEKKPSFGVSTILPSYTFGPAIQAISKPDDINFSVSLVFQYFVGQKQVVENPPRSSFVDVRDVALAHVRALERPEVSTGQRFITSSDNFSFQQIVDTLRRRFPDRAGVITPGEPGKNYPTNEVTLSGKKAEELLGIRYRNIEESVVDTSESLKRFV